ncbi:hypothetical protein ACQ4M3_27240 [Leptolyngbya sp. AN03gr2]|uniref:hypothetical protein n=1 Tax=unclassified Leptolyngbya TaxID=2650499 RepID=UPI003D310064
MSSVKYIQASLRTGERSILEPDRLIHRQTLLIERQTVPHPASAYRQLPLTQ